MYLYFFHMFWSFWERVMIICVSMANGGGSHTFLMQSLSLICLLNPHLFQEPENLYGILQKQTSQDLWTCMESLRTFEKSCDPFLGSYETKNVRIFQKPFGISGKILENLTDAVKITWDFRTVLLGLSLRITSQTRLTGFQ